MSEQPTLSKTEIEHLAHLARLELTPAEAEHYAKQLGEVLAYVNKLQALSPEQGAGASGEGVSLRADAVLPWSTPDELIAQAPENHDNLVQVPAVFDRE